MVLSHIMTATPPDQCHPGRRGRRPGNRHLQRPAADPAAPVQRTDDRTGAGWNRSDNRG